MALGGLVIQYRKQLTLFQSYSVHTELHSWDSKWFYLRQKFISGGKVHAVVFAKLVIKRGRNDVPFDEALRALGYDPDTFHPKGNISNAFKTIEDTGDI